ncbi:hypothetical protein P691DRAFT_804796 [Macrolepiota fuliginosa MF-IS2]|uniref:Uncharacterized protein n=1 Tax=Macrolepiota fuliginosa MF-IS2 TaxID=1400762 RepID=A0A9P6C201_9AGAR|nr:hypothetical protein P691DRAFT_804796 [Macrolepiota fuliginosa MF-IS2]
MELESCNVWHARHFNHAVILLPRVAQLWYKCVYLGQFLQNTPGATTSPVMQWESDDKTRWTRNRDEAAIQRARQGRRNSQKTASLSGQVRGCG